MEQEPFPDGLVAITVSCPDEVRGISRNAAKSRHLVAVVVAPILRPTVGTGARFIEFTDRMRRDAAAQREREGRGPVELAGVLGRLQ